MWPTRPMALHQGAASPGHHKDVPPGAAASLCVSLQWEATNIEDLAFVSKRVLVSRMLTFVIVSAKVIKKRSLITCSMA